MNKEKRMSVPLALAIALFVVLVLFPFYWIIVTSFKSQGELYSFSALPKQFTLEAYKTIFTARPFLRYLLNSFIVSSVTTVIAVFISAVTAYAIARLEFKGKTVILGLVLAVSMLPTIATITPIYVLIKNLGLRNTYLGLILPYISFALPMAIWYLTSFFKSIPFSMEEAARMDGASTFTIFFRIVAPLAVPGVFTTGILVFITAWNEYLFALTINTDDLMRTVPVGITMYPGQYTIPWGELSAAIVVVTIPLVVLVLICQRQIVGGLVSGAVKG